MKILHRYSGAVLWESPCSTMRETVVKAVAAKSNLCGANLRGANLRDAYLCDADLCDADLCDADLSGAYLRDADLSGAYLRGADLCDADLSGAYLRGANLRGAYLRGANLRDASLRDASLCDASLCDAKNFTPLQKARFSIVPDTGSFTAWKKCKDEVLVKLQIPDDAKRSNSTGRKCRAEKALVLEVIGAKEAVSAYNPSVKYRAGETVVCDKWNEDRWVECGGGIHFFITRPEAEDYQP